MKGNTKKPGENTGKKGGIYIEKTPKGGTLPNYVTVPDNHTLPPTTKHGNVWSPLHITPNSKK